MFFDFFADIIPHYHYCEDAATFRVAQPLNAFSNIVYVIICVLFLRNGFASLAQVTICVALTSFLWHTTGLYSFLVVDVLSVMLLSGVMTFIIAQRAGWHNLIIFVFMLGLLVLVMLFRDLFPTFFLQNSAAFLPIVLVLLLFSAFQRDIWVFCAGCALFSGIMFRSMDGMICDVWPYGTHFLWHISGGFCLFFILKSSILNHKASKKNGLIHE